MKYNIPTLMALSQTPSVQLHWTAAAKDCKLLRFPGSCKKPTLAPDKSSNTAGALVNESQSQRPVKTQKHRSRRRPKPTTRKTPQSLLANSDTGFAQFLREHTTSQHQRVTAGGRIVPMSNEQSEQREHPRLNDEQPDVMPAARPQWRFGDFDTGGEPREIVELQREIDALRRRGRANVELTAGDPDNSMLGEPHDPSPTDRELSPESLEYRNLRSLLRHPRPRIPYAWECPGFEFAQVVRGYFTTDDPYGEIEWEWEYILRQEIDFHTPPDHLSMHLDRASSGESFSPRGFRMSLNWAVLHYSLSVEGLIELRMHLNTLWEDFSFLLSQITQHIASVEVPASELYEFRRMYIRLREEVSQWMYRAGDMIRYVDPLYSDQYDTDTEWEEEEYPEPESKPDDHGQYHNEDFHGDRDAGAGAQCVNDERCKEDDELRDLFKHRARSASDPLQCNHQNRLMSVGGHTQFDCTSILPGHGRKVSQANSMPEMNEVIEQVKKVVEKVECSGSEAADHETNMDCDEVSDVEPHYSEPSHNSRLRTVSGATTYSSNQRIPDIDTTDTSSRIIASSPLNTKPHASNLFLRAWIEHLKTPAVDPTSPLHGGVPLAVNIQDTLDVLYHPASGTSYVRSLNEAPQYPLPVTTGTEELTSRRQRIQGLLDGVLSYVHVHQKENLGSQVFGPDDVVDDMPQMPTEGIVASRQARQRHVNKIQPTVVSVQAEGVFAKQ